VGQIAEGEEFDLVVATNILVYYDRFQQGLAMAGIARMMSSGGVFLSNTVLPAQRPMALEYLGRRSVNYSASGNYGDDVVAYRRK
jgi:predicted TPR repeat methyltransferase